MSIILDALRKSENSRLRQDHPAIFTARTASRRAALPTWALVLIAALAVNLLVMAYVLLRNSSGIVTTAASAASAAASPAAASTAAASTAAVSAAAASPAETSAAAPLATAPRGAAEASIASPARAALAAPRSAPAAPSRDDLLARGSSIPPAELNMHVFDPNPQARFVLLNGQRLREGEVSSEGLAVERITADGVVLRFGSSTFAVNLQ